MSADQVDPEEDVDIPPERRVYIATTYERLASISDHELLGVPPGADKKTIKRAYFQLAGLVHPDRYFGKRLGRYKPGDVYQDRQHKTQYTISRVLRSGPNEFLIYLKPMANKAGAVM